MTSILLNLSHHLTCPDSPSVWLTILCFFRAFLLCCGSVTKSCLILCDPVDYSTSTVSQSLFKFMPIESVIPSNHLILCHLTSFSRLLGSCSPVALLLPHWPPFSAIPWVWSMWIPTRPHYGASGHVPGSWKFLNFSQGWELETKKKPLCVSGNALTP